MSLAACVLHFPWLCSPSLAGQCFRPKRCGHRSDEHPEENSALWVSLPPDSLKNGTYVFICIYMCVCIYTYICLCICIYIYKYTMYVCIYKYMYMYLCIYIYIHNIYIYIYIFISRYVCMYIYIYIYVLRTLIQEDERRHEPHVCVGLKSLNGAAAQCRLHHLEGAAACKPWCALLWAS